MRTISDRAAFALVAACLGAACVGNENASERRSTATATASTPPTAETPSAASREASSGDASNIDPEAPMPGPGRRRLESAVDANAKCVSCHETEAAEWRSSRHRQSNTNAAYRASFAIEPTAFCRGCHAPESDPAIEPPASVSELGVACVTCHVTEEGIVLATAVEGGKSAPHRLRRSAAFADTGACAACHEFRFPAVSGSADEDLMQSTVREHRRSSGSGSACASCHMPMVDGRRSHAFTDVRDPEWLRASLGIAAERLDDGRVRVTLSQRMPGHGFPTGDLFRRLEVGVEFHDPNGKILQREVRHLARHLEILPGSARRRLTLDDRVFDTAKVIELSLAEVPPSARVSWWVTYQRVATVGAGTDPADAKIESEVRLAGGKL